MSCAALATSMARGLVLCFGVHNGGALIFLERCVQVFHLCVFGLIGNSRFRLLTLYAVLFRS